MKCPQCNKEGKLTQTKPRKTDGKTFAVYECLGGCKNDRGYAFSWFPPKGNKGGAVGSAPVQPPQVGAVADMLHELQEIKVILLRINAKMTEKAPKTAQAEPDCEVEVGDEEGAETPF